MRSRFGSLLGMREHATALQAAVDAELSASAALPRQTAGPSSVGVFRGANHLNPIVWADLTGADTGAITRDTAMSIPALARQRHLLCGTVARCPLVLDPPAGVTYRPRWHDRTDGLLSPWHRMLWTVDDLIHDGWSLWRATRGRDELQAVTRIPPYRWDTDEADRILIDGELADERDVIAIPGPHEGICNFAASTLRRTIDNLDAAANAARNPSAYLELHYTGDADLTDDEIDAHIGRWAAARRGENGGVAWTNRVLELREHGTHESHLLIEGRNADAVDMSRIVSSPASMTDATSAGASLTYETTTGRNGQFIDYGAGLYMDAIASRLSQDDVTGPGWRVAFDTTELRTLVPDPTDDPAGPTRPRPVGSPTPSEDA